MADEVSRHARISHGPTVGTGIAEAADHVVAAQHRADVLEITVIVVLVRVDEQVPAAMLAEEVDHELVRLPAFCLSAAGHGGETLGLVVGPCGVEFEEACHDMVAPLPEASWHGAFGPGGPLLEAPLVLRSQGLPKLLVFLQPLHLFSQGQAAQRLEGLVGNEGVQTALQAPTDAHGATAALAPHVEAVRLCPLDVIQLLAPQCGVGAHLEQQDCDGSARDLGGLADDAELTFLEPVPVHLQDASIGLAHAPSKSQDLLLRRGPHVGRAAIPSAMLISA
mmetsp:Transcript_83506/g.186601  ORF Transcript_83506/g.186601 Transcript_83506/m.186601 type:complete len:279 (-) Transcript_83506:520-1356(-)